MKALNLLVLTLVIVGAINWGLVGFFDFDLVATIFGGEDAIGSRIVYGIVGLAGLWAIAFYGPLGREHEEVPRSHT